MKRIFLFLLLLGALLSCAPRGRVIPKEKLAEIYADMFVADQWVADKHLRSALDTASLYGAVLERYGYTVEDYRVTAQEYLKDPERYAKIIKKTMKILEQREKDLKKEIQRQEALKDLDKARDVYLPQWRFALSPMDHPDIFHLADSIAIYVDSIGDKPWIFENDKYKPTPIIDDGNIEIVPVPDGSDEP
ncbi:MAG: DUF4296 domain-containing protein [Bacteroidales bacterium]|nr:DUF4296 domain-containing protein [Bacteroidales bacterium]